MPLFLLGPYFVSITKYKMADTYTERKMLVTNYSLFIQNMNCCIKDIKLLIEVNPKKYLDAGIIKSNDNILFQVLSKYRKFPVCRSSETPTNYKFHFPLV